MTELTRAKLEKMIETGQVFRPGAPIDRYTLFAGRSEQVQNVINGITQRGQHVIIYGERGVGKTSLANILSDLFTGRDASLGYVRVNCDKQDTFSTLFHKVFRELTITVPKQPLGFHTENQYQQLSLDSILPVDISPEDVRYWFQKLGDWNIVVIDEVDRMVDPNTTALLADTIKTLSDHSSGSTIVLVGVADSVDELILEHRSVERALVQVQMPRMTVEELSEIIDKALEQLEMEIESASKVEIANLSQGLPHYTHLLGLHAAQRAIEQDRNRILPSDVKDAIDKAVESAQQSIISAYHSAISSPKQTLYTEVLLACALANKDDLGYFAATDVRQPLSLIMGKPYDIPAFSRHLNKFCDAERGPVLQKTGAPRRWRFRFINPLMQPYVTMNGVTKGLVSRTMVSRQYND